MLNENSPLSYWLANAAGAGSIVATIAGWVPPLAAGVALVWYLIQITESQTVQNWIKNRRLRKIARLKAEAIMLEAKMHQPTTPSALSPD